MEQLDFSIDNDLDRQKLLTEAIEIVRYASRDLGLGKECDSTPLEALKTQAIELLENFRSEKATFSPTLQVRQLTKKDLQVPEAELSPDLKARMRRYHFYKVDIPITLVSDTGWAFTRFQCKVDFSSGEEEAQRLPIIHDMFPTDEWQDILSFQDHLVLGLDENLAFRAEIGQVAARGMLSGDVQSKLLFQVGGGAKLAVGPFDYKLSRAKVKSRGRGNVTGYWFLEGQKCVDKDVELGIILMVPKQRELPVNAIGALKVSHDFQLWTADVLKDFRKYFVGAIESFFRGGAEISATQAWQDITQQTD